MATIIRHEQAGFPLPFSFQDVEKCARSIVDDARAQALQIVTLAQRRADEEVDFLRREVYKTAAAEGRAAGIEQVRAESWDQSVTEQRGRLTSLDTALQKLIAELEQAKRALIAQSETGLIRLALEIARRVCKIQVGASSDAAVANARALLEMTGGHDDVELHLCPEEHELVSKLLSSTIQQLEHATHVRLIPDSELTRGSCRVVTAAGQIDAAIEAQLDRVAAAICAREAGRE